MAKCLPAAPLSTNPMTVKTVCNCPPLTTHTIDTIIIAMVMSMAIMANFSAHSPSWNSSPTGFPRSLALNSVNQSTQSCAGRRRSGWWTACMKEWELGSSLAALGIGTPLGVYCAMCQHCLLVGSHPLKCSCSFSTCMILLNSLTTKHMWPDLTAECTSIGMICFNFLNPNIRLHTPCSSSL